MTEEVRPPRIVAMNLSQTARKMANQYSNLARREVLMDEINELMNELDTSLTKWDADQEAAAEARAAANEPIDPGDDDSDTGDDGDE